MKDERRGPRLWQMNAFAVLLTAAVLGAFWFIAAPKQDGVWAQCKLLTNDVTAGEVCDEFGR